MLLQYTTSRVCHGPETRSVSLCSSESARKLESYDTLIEHVFPAEAKQSTARPAQGHCPHAGLLQARECMAALQQAVRRLTYLFDALSTGARRYASAMPDPMELNSTLRKRKRPVVARMQQKDSIDLLAVSPRKTRSTAGAAEAALLQVCFPSYQCCSGR